MMSSPFLRVGAVVGLVSRGSGAREGAARERGRGEQVVGRYWDCLGAGKREGSCLFRARGVLEC